MGNLVCYDNEKNSDGSITRTEFEQQQKQKQISGPVTAPEVEELFNSLAGADGSWFSKSRQTIDRDSLEKWYAQDRVIAQ